LPIFLHPHQSAMNKERLASFPATSTVHDSEQSALNVCAAHPIFTLRAPNAEVGAARSTSILLSTSPPLIIPMSTTMHPFAQSALASKQASKQARERT